MSLIKKIPLLISFCARNCHNGSTVEEQVERHKLNQSEKEQLVEYLNIYNKTYNFLGSN